MTSNTKLSLAGLATAAAMLLGALPASAEGLGAGGLPIHITSSASVTAQTNANAGASLSNVISRGDADIAARMSALNALGARVQSMSNVSATEKAALSSELQTNITGLTSLRAQIDAETDVGTARSDSKSIFTSYRIYALVIPRGWVLASADRMESIASMMSALSVKLQARINAQPSGTDVSALTAAIVDMNAKIADANTQATAAKARVSVLAPDQGDQAVATSNHSALVAARADIRVGTQDLQAARKDVEKIVKGLKALNVTVTASTTVQ